MVYTEPSALHAVSAGLEAAGLEAEQTTFVMIPSTTVQVEDEDGARKTLRLLDRLEDNEDVQNVWANFEIPDEVMANLEEE